VGAAGPAGCNRRFLALFRFCSALNCRGRNLSGYRRRRLAGPKHSEETGRFPPDGLRPPNLPVFPVDGGLFLSFAGTADQYRQDPIYMRCLPVLFHAGNRYETNCRVAGHRDDLIRDRRDSIQRL